MILNIFQLLPSTNMLIALIVAGEFTENHYTIEGTSLHERVHTLGERHREETWQVRAIWLKSERYIMSG